MTSGVAVCFPKIWTLPSCKTTILPTRRPYHFLPTFDGLSCRWHRPRHRCFRSSCSSRDGFPWHPRSMVYIKVMKSYLKKNISPQFHKFLLDHFPFENKEQADCNVRLPNVISPSSQGLLKFTAVVNSKVTLHIANQCGIRNMAIFKFPMIPWN